MPAPCGRPCSAILWLQLLFVASIASVVLVLIAAVRAAQSSQIVAERALADYANFAAWSYREHLLTGIREGVDELLGSVNPGDGLHTGPGIPDARKMGHMMAWDPTCYCHHPRHGPLPKHYLGFTLAFLGASPEEYTAILTPNASAACRLVGESFPFAAGSKLALPADNHNSVNGIRSSPGVAARRRSCCRSTRSCA